MKIYKLFHLFLFAIIFKTEAQVSVLSVVDSLMQTGNYQLALKELKIVKPQAFEVLLKQGEIYQATGNYSNAITFYNKTLKLKPLNKIKQKLGKSYLQQGQVNKAMELYEEILISDTTNLILQYDLAKIYTKEYKPKKAINLYEKLIKSDSGNPNYYYSLGKIYQNKGSTGFLKSGNYFLSAYDVDSTHVKSIYELAKFYKKLHFKDSTTLFIDKGLSLTPKSINFNQLKAKDALFKKEYDTTLVYLKKLENLNFKTMFVYKMYGLTYLNMKDYDNAEKYFNIAMRKDFSDASVSYNLGLVYKLKGNFKKAKMFFNMSIMNLKPDVDKHYFELGLISLEENNLKAAVLNFKEAYQNNHKNYFALFQLGLASDEYYKDKKIPLQYFQKYIDQFSTKDEKSFKYAKQKIKELKKELFLEGVKIE